MKNIRNFASIEYCDSMDVTNPLTIDAVEKISITSHIIKNGGYSRTLRLWAMD